MIETVCRVKSLEGSTYHSIIGSYTTNCAINSPQTQGDGTANSPMNLQITEITEEASTPPISELFSTNFNIVIRVECNPLIVCPNEDECRYRMEPDERIDTIEVEPAEVR